MMVPKVEERQGREIDRYLKAKNCVEIAFGCYLCKVCDIFTDQPEKHRHGDFLE
jgi:hypothetical protein